ncbi:MAG TPA: HAD-IA family hydrolase [Gaiellaceae bacterium]|nr:HAD-IA family hydrolase [Gaiellaceae bacterium]
MSDRWATFDCYGTLIDWNGGIAAQLGRFFGEAEAARLLDRYHEVEPRIEGEDPERSYRTVLTMALERLADEEGLALPDGEHDALAASLPSWSPFPETRAALEEARARGWRLAILSNTDRDFIDASRARIGVPFDETIVASEIGSYKPGHRHWTEFFARTGAERSRHVHVAASLFHDVAPARELGLTSIWVNRLAETAGPVPTREVADLANLADVLDELVAA